MKLYVEEAESAALKRELVRWPVRTSSVLLAVEAVRACRRFGEPVAGSAQAGLASVALLGFDERVIDAARRLEPLELRSLDAIHLATALSLGADLGAVFSYDERLVAAARVAGVRVMAPV